MRMIQGEGGSSRRRLGGDVCGVGDSSVVFMTLSIGFTVALAKGGYT